MSLNDRSGDQVHGGIFTTLEMSMSGLNEKGVTRTKYGTSRRKPGRYSRERDSRRDPRAQSSETQNREMSEGLKSERMNFETISFDSTLVTPSSDDPFDNNAYLNSIEVPILSKLNLQLDGTSFPSQPSSIGTNNIPPFSSNSSGPSFGYPSRELIGWESGATLSQTPVSYPSSSRNNFPNADLHPANYMYPQVSGLLPPHNDPQLQGYPALQLDSYPIHPFLASSPCHSRSSFQGPSPRTHLSSVQDPQVSSSMPADFDLLLSHCHYPTEDWIVTTQPDMLDTNVSDWLPTTNVNSEYGQPLDLDFWKQIVNTDLSADFGLQSQQTTSQQYSSSNWLDNNIFFSQ
jgi:hypothetical protein